MWPAWWPQGRVKPVDTHPPWTAKVGPQDRGGHHRAEPEKHEARAAGPARTM